jgi:hypothetical protein
VARLNIPQHYRAGIAALRTLDDPSVKAIRAALDRAVSQQSEDLGAVPTPPHDMAINAITRVSSIKREDFKLIGEAVGALYGVKSAREVSVDEFVEEVCDAMESLPEEDLRLPHGDRSQFKEKLLTLLNADVFSLAAKVYDLATEDERVFCHARILTDLRPVFGPKVEEGPKGMLVVHLLRLAYHEGSDKTQNFYVSLDADDLQTLRRLIDRAEAKAKTLKSAVRDTRIFGLLKE